MYVQVAGWQNAIKSLRVLCGSFAGFMWQFLSLLVWHKVLACFLVPDSPRTLHNPFHCCRPCSISNSGEKSGLILEVVVEGICRRHYNRHSSCQDVALVNAWRLTAGWTLWCDACDHRPVNRTQCGSASREEIGLRKCGCISTGCSLAVGQPLVWSGHSALAQLLLQTLPRLTSSFPVSNFSGPCSYRCHFLQKMRATYKLPTRLSMVHAIDLCWTLLNRTVCSTHFINHDHVFVNCKRWALFLEVNDAQ